MVLMLSLYLAKEIDTFILCNNIIVLNNIQGYTCIKLINYACTQEHHIPWGFSWVHKAYICPDRDPFNESNINTKLTLIFIMFPFAVYRFFACDKLVRITWPISGIMSKSRRVPRKWENDIPMNRRSNGIRWNFMSRRGSPEWCWRCYTPVKLQHPDPMK